METKTKSPSESIKQAAIQIGLRMAELGYIHAAEGKPAATLELIDRVIKTKQPSMPDDIRLIHSHGLHDNYMIGYDSVAQT